MCYLTPASGRHFCFRLNVGLNSRILRRRSLLMLTFFYRLLATDPDQSVPQGALFAKANGVFTGFSLPMPTEVNECWCVRAPCVSTHVSCGHSKNKSHPACGETCDIFI